jgi:hypothetical protein
MNNNPFRARQEKKARGKPLALQEVLAILSDAIRKTEALLDGEEDRDFILRCTHALSQSCGQYARLSEVGELENRIRILESALQGRVA